MPPSEHPPQAHYTMDEPRFGTVERHDTRSPMVYDRGQTSASQPTHPPIMQNGRERERTRSETEVSLGKVHPPHAESIVRPNPADSYLDRVEHDPQLKKMLVSAPSKTIHTNSVPAPNGRSQLTPSLAEKPLPNPYLERPGPQQPTNIGRNPHYLSNRFSLSEGLNTDAHTQSHIVDGDRYPAFPGRNGRSRGHSRQSSYGSIDPAALAIPL